MLGVCISVLAVMCVCGALDTPSHAFVIALDARRGAEVAAHIKLHLSLQNVQVVVANNGMEATLPLYTQFLIKHGRREHVQIGNRAMVGCLLSHVNIWRMVSGWAYVFEEDALLDDNSLQRVSRLLRDVPEFSVLMLQARRFESSGVSSAVGSLAATCETCTWFGTRGYIVTEEGAGILLQHVDPVVVQVDALMGLVNEFDPSFRFFWTQHDIVGNAYPFESTLWDGCVFACFDASLQFVCLLLVVLLGAVVARFKLIRDSCF